MKKMSIIIVITIAFILLLATTFGNEIKYKCDDEEKELINYYLYKNDSDYIEDFTNHNGTIEILDSVVSDSGNECKGYIKMRNFTITIQMEPDYIVESFNHEFGHFVDYTQNGKSKFSDEEEFLNAWELDHQWFETYYDDYLGGYFGGNNEECFAQSYLLYVEDNEDFKVGCPNIYNFMKDNIKKGE